MNATDLLVAARQHIEQREPLPTMISESDLLVLYRMVDLERWKRKGVITKEEYQKKLHDVEHIKWLLDIQSQSTEKIQEIYRKLAGVNVEMATNDCETCKKVIKILHDIDLKKGGSAKPCN